MSNLTTTGTAGYPGVLDSVTTLVDGVGNDLYLARHPNGLGAAVIALETELGTDPAGTAVDLKTRLAVALNNDGTVKTSVVVAGNGAQVAYSAGVFTLAWSPDGPGYVQNAGLDVVPNSPVANALRIRIVGRDGATPTAAAPVRAAFRVSTTSSTPAQVSYVVREITGDTQMALSSGSSLNFTDNQLGRFYVHLIDNNGTPEVAVARYANFNEGELVSTTAEGGAGGADADDTLYSTTARSAVPVRCYAQVDIRCPTAGNWTQNPMTMNIMGPGIKRTGEVVQYKRFSTTSTATTSAAIPYDSTPPQKTEGKMFFWGTVTATSPVNRWHVKHTAGYYWSAAAQLVLAAFRNSATDAEAATAFMGATNGAESRVTLEFSTVTAATTTTGWKMYAGTPTGVLTYGGSVSMGDTNSSLLEIWEECA